MKDQRPLMIGFAGAAGSSKSPIAHYLSWNLGLPIFSHDIIRDEVRADTGRDWVNNKAYINRRDARWESVLKLGRTFIYDASVDRRWSDGMKKRIKDAGYDWFLISIDLSSEFYTHLSNAKGYVAKDQARWLTEHQSFLDLYSSDVGLSIAEKDFPHRLDLSLQAVKAIL